MNSLSTLVLASGILLGFAAVVWLLAALLQNTFGDLWKRKDRKKP